jgi:hypothetical protein
MQEIQFLDEPGLDARLPILCRGGSPNKFIHAFECVVERIPTPTRAALVHYWAKKGAMPDIVLENVRVIKVNGAIALGLTDDRGHTLRFAGLATYSMPDKILETLIAHEFGHVDFWMEVDLNILPPDQIAEVNNMPLDSALLNDWSEKFAEDKALSWSDEFETSAVYAWFDDYLDRERIPRPPGARPRVSLTATGKAEDLIAQVAAADNGEAELDTSTRIAGCIAAGFLVFD